ncbi:MAG: porphobilinogen synthase [Akkermansiaceae bacterium]|nr:porphobilinogen synthase [Akkermansiaceae bacterium]
MNLTNRPRRNRKSAAVRGLMRETSLAASHLIYPMFVQEGEENTPIESLPGCTRWCVADIAAECSRLFALGIHCVDLFAVVPEEKKDAAGTEAWNPTGVVPRAIAAIKAAVPQMCVMTDVALDPFNTYGQDGIVKEYDNGDYEILNDETVTALCRQALCHARAGADIISPSDMMDGRVAAIRAALDAEGFTKVSILSYTAKYASAFYGPFRGALGSAPKFGDKKTYQMDPANRREAVREALADVEEGADMLMVKPATMYLDVIAELRKSTNLPIAAYHVSGEYLMIKAAAASGWLDERSCMLESLLSIRRAGADMILTYAAPQVAEWLTDSPLN